MGGSTAVAAAVAYNGSCRQINVLCAVLSAAIRLAFEYTVFSVCSLRERRLCQTRTSDDSV